MGTRVTTGRSVHDVGLERMEGRLLPWGVGEDMSRFTLSLCSGVLVIAGALCGGSQGEEPAGLEELPRLEASPNRYLGTLSCASTSCHGVQDDAAGQGQAKRQEYALWLAHDPHARAARTLESREFERIVRRVSSGRDDGPAEEAVAARCAKCHDPDGGAQAGQARGLSCETCHGPARDWIAVHYERDSTRERLAALGMRDTKNLGVRAELCVRCHVGDAERDMNHDMIAAGHPPLRFELSAYHDLIRHKHWPAGERLRTPQFKAQLWAAGQAAVLRCTLELLHARADRAARGERFAPWPEFAEYDCFACHQRMRPASGFSGVARKGARPGVPGWQSWNLVLAEALYSEHDRSSFARLREEMHGSLVTDPARVRELVRAAQASRQQRESMTAADIVSVVRPLIQSDKDWAARCQQLLALRAADLATRDERLRLQPPPGFVTVTSGREEPRRQAADELDRAWRSIAAALRFGSSRFEWPAFDWQGLPAVPTPDEPLLTESEIALALTRLAGELRQQAEASQP
jgi:hypothetical protein